MSRKSPPKKRVAPLEAYRAKRDFAATPEPKAKVVRKAGRSFVVQEHHARSHHFDFRLEMDGVLVSWAVPKGVPDDPAAKRLAVHVEDHPLEYGKFQGEIPKGHYGAGKVAIWDRGTWEPLDPDWRKAFAKGKLKFVLRGERLQGVYVLAKMREEPNWLMRLLESEVPREPSAAPVREKAEFVAPQLAQVVPAVPSGKEWRHELKLDGYRLIAVKTGKILRLFTRNALDWTDRFPDLAKALARVSKHDFVMDGEAVVFDAEGRTRFGELQAALQSGDHAAMRYVAFDLLHENGENLRDLTFEERIARLAKLVEEDGEVVRRSRVWPAEAGKELFRQACARGLEGIISKRAAGHYHPGERRDWTKSKCRARQEFVVCGYTPPKGSLKGFGALILGSYENGKWVPRGKVGTGFSQADRLRLLRRFEPLRVPRPPFDDRTRGVTWLKPERVVEIEFAEITRDGNIRQGSFVGLREDKMSAQVSLDLSQTASIDESHAKVGGIRISHPDRRVYPTDGILKIEVARYFERVAPLMLPFLKNRPLALLRAPEGITGQTFFQKSLERHVPDHVRTPSLDDGTSVIAVNDAKGLVTLAQYGTLEFHPWGATLDQPDRPDQLVWDLDPGPGVVWKEVLGTAFLLRDFLGDLGLDPLVKTSGGKGLHIVLNLKRLHGWETMKPFAKAVAAAVAAQNPKRLTIIAAKAKRHGRIYIDWLRNGRGATCVAPWCLRARPGAPVSMPVEWEQLREVTAAGFTIHDPPEKPEGWLKPKLQTIRKKTLEDLGIEPG